jgi:hypothetical protein
MIMRLLRGCSKATAIALPIGLCACITVERPAEDVEDSSESTGRDEASAEAGDAGDGTAARNARRTSENAGDGGGQAEADEEDMRAQAGSSAAVGGGAGQASAGSGSAAQDAGTSTREEQHFYCGIMRVTVRVCNGTQDTSYGEDCVDDAVDCLTLLPPDERIDYNEYCYTRTEYHVFGDEAQPGSCEQFYGYWNDELECLLDSHCGSGERCIDNACLCPEGADCVCPYCGPQPARCDGQTLVEQVGAGPCDENRQCVYHERTTDCAAMGLICDADASACVVPPVPPTPGSGDSGTPGGGGGTPGPSPSP